MEVVSGDSENDAIHILQSFRQRPALYIGEKSLERLGEFISGYEFARLIHPIKDPPLFHIPHEFFTWVDYRLGYYGSTSGWVEKIRERSANEGEAWDRFWMYYDEFHDRQKYVVAQLLGYERRIHFSPGPKGEDYVEKVNSPLSLYAHPESKGIYREGEHKTGVFHRIEDLETTLSISRDDLVLLDQTWNYGIQSER
ncbi:MAG: hypothetical protein CMJ46_07095 [Planctomyces sp.]|nr:hypothetical protein [Planctomyces sp.]